MPILFFPLLFPDTSYAITPLRRFRPGALRKVYSKALLTVPRVSEVTPQLLQPTLGGGLLATITQSDVHQLRALRL